jgi:putative GTP pyrophosphokinase
MNGKISKREAGKIDELVAYYRENLELFERFMGYVQTLFSKAEALRPYIHSMKWRIKNPDHLKDKLNRQVKKCRELNKRFVVTRENLFKEVTDLVGYRILHLHTTQIDDINKIILALLTQENYVLIEGPIARTWDSESTAYFKSIGIETKDTGRMYTSVHYIFKANRRALPTCELQVRTLAEEVWGEVDHMINYPHPSPITACREQIKVLARVTSSCSRLVDSIFHSHHEGITQATVQGKRRHVNPDTSAKDNRPVERSKVKRAHG